MSLNNNSSENMTKQQRHRERNRERGLKNGKRYYGENKERLKKYFANSVTF